MLYVNMGSMKCFDCGDIGHKRLRLMRTQVQALLLQVTMWTHQSPGAITQRLQILTQRMMLWFGRVAQLPWISAQQQEYARKCD